VINFLSAIEPGARAAHLCAYRDYLLERDGSCDVARRTLSRREEQMQRFEQVAPKASLDAQLFADQYSAFDPTRQTPRDMLLLLTLCKLNAAEAYGVDKSFDLVAERTGAESEIEQCVMVEEHYHTRILLSSAREFGISVSKSFQPPLNLRGLISGITAVPPGLSRPLVLASELVGTLLFAQTFVRAGEILADRPVLRDLIQERIVEILIDEIGHVTFNQLQLGSFGMFNARRLFPVVALGLSNIAREWRLLDINATTDTSWLARVPEEVARRAFMVRETTAWHGRSMPQNVAAE
jgi:hypothetical protein